MDTKRICSVCGKALAANAPEGLCPECLLKAGMGTGADLGADTGTKATQRTFNAPCAAELAPLFPQLEIFELIGKGGMGAVYRARQKDLDRIVALKILPPDIGQNPAFAERFAREAKALARLNHPGIVTIYDFGRANGLFFFLMEFVDGMNLQQLLNTGRISPREALAIVVQICDAMQFAHDQGIVHRDIKPKNILLDRRGHVKVADFGLAKLMGTGNEPAAAGGTVACSPTLTESGKIMGTLQYMSPEQISAPGEVDHRADIYALGVVFYQMLTGELPGRKIEPPSRKVQIDVRLDEVVLRALEKKPALRYQQASMFKTQIETIATTPPTAQAEEPPRKSGMVRFVEIFFDITFTSPAAVRLLNISALGFFGSLGFLGFVSPDWRWCFGFFGLCGLFGLIGLAFIVEMFAVRAATPKGSLPRWAKWGPWCVGAGLLLMLVPLLYAFRSSHSSFNQILNTNEVVDFNSPAAGSADPRLERKVEYSTRKASVQDIVQSLAEQAGLKYNWQKSFDQTDPLCRQWVWNVTIDGKTCQQALEQILEPVGLRYKVENGVLVLSRQEKRMQNAPQQRGAAGETKATNKFYATLAEMMKDPQSREMLRAQQQMMIDQTYADLAVPADKFDALKELLLDRQMAITEPSLGMMNGTMAERGSATTNIVAIKAEYDQKIKDLLGAQGFQSYQDYEKSLVERMQIQVFNGTLPADSALTNQQENDLISAMYEERLAMPSLAALSKQTSTSSVLSSNQLAGLEAQMTELQQHDLKRAAAILTRGQLEHFKEWQEQMAGAQSAILKEMFGDAPTSQTGGNRPSVSSSETNDVK
ncbi:MAG TPA: protein kinase [Alphaproteobacteria bacterium]|nr:protein kinase [Alphaproteobacteria bacterium]